ncbi:MAG TPA: NAD(P)(+) transhydrogenase (Re/Si-specific) subunit beta [Kofleriaceae bacterium]|nr:NAD(P)(+) transhydrogenase (Re/Si-specific) subunit beta [Kofleriaceae bacterium]
MSALNAQHYVYLVGAALFVLSIKWMGQVRTSRKGNWAGSLAMVLAVAGTLLPGHYGLSAYGWIVGAVLIGAVIGIPMALIMPMTAVPQRTALSHAFGGLAAGLVGTAEYLEFAPNIPRFVMGALAAEMLLGYLTFTGSLLAFAKLQEIVSTKPIIYPGRNAVSMGTLIVAIVSAIYMTINPGHEVALYVLMAASLGFGLFLVMPIGGADMPTVIAILNSYAGLSAAAMGFVLNNKLLIIAGALDGSSGLILSIIMCKAMNRSFANVLFGGMGQTIAKAGDAGPAREVKAYTVEDAVTMLEDARLVIVVPGYGMAVAQAQHAVKELATVLMARGCDVKFAIHPVAGRMPGHMNVLLAEADVSYDQLLELEHVNPLFPEADMAIVLGANDVVNPAARTKVDSPLYGMPILDVDKARSVMVIKRSMNTGFAGIDNDLFYLDNTMMVFGDAKKVMTEIVADFKRINA